MVNFLKNGVLSQDMSISACHSFKIKASHNCMLGDILYHHGYDGILLRCLEWVDW